MKGNFQVRFLGGAGAERLPSYPVLTELIRGKTMNVGLIAGITGIAIAMAGILLTLMFNLQFRRQLKFHYPDIHVKMFPNGSIGWQGAKILKN